MDKCDRRLGGGYKKATAVQEGKCGVRYHGKTRATRQAVCMYMDSEGIILQRRSRILQFPVI